MKTKLNFFIAPITSLFKIDVYKKAANSNAGSGMLYLLYLTFLSTVIIFILTSVVIMPKTDAFMDWFEKEMPPLTWTPNGVMTDAVGRYTMIHPDFGPVITVDTLKTEVSPQEMGDSLVFVTGKRIFVKESGNLLRDYDITRQNMQINRKAPKQVKLNGELVKSFYDKMKGSILFITIITVFLILFIVNISAALLYSVLGLIFNQFKGHKFSYAPIFNISCFAMSAAFIIGWVKAIPVLNWLPFGVIGSILVTGLYLFFVIKKLKNDSPNISSQAA